MNWKSIILNEVTQAQKNKHHNTILYVNSIFDSLILLFIMEHIRKAEKPGADLGEFLKDQST